MELRRELLLTVGGLVVVNLLLAFGAVGLFVRMEPAIGRILADGASSVVAVEETLAAAGEARRLASAGAWAAVLMGFLSFGFGFFSLMRLQNRFVRPLEDLHEVLSSVRQGGRLRRCRPSDAPREIVQVTQLVNTLLDERLGLGHEEGHPHATK